MTATQDALMGLATTSVWQEDFYKQFHAHPELSSAGEPNGGGDRSSPLGFRVRGSDGRRGVVACCQRARDSYGADAGGYGIAPPVPRLTGLPYASIETAVDADRGDRWASCTRAVTTCTSPALLGAAKLMAAHREAGPARTSRCSSPPRRRRPGQGNGRRRPGRQDAAARRRLRPARDAFAAGTDRHARRDPVLSAGESP